MCDLQAHSTQQRHKTDNQEHRSLTELRDYCLGHKLPMCWSALETDGQHSTKALKPELAGTASSKPVAKECGKNPHHSAFSDEDCINILKISVALI